MAEEKDIFKELLSILNDILQPGVEIFNDPNSRAALLDTYGLPDSGGTIPDISPLQNYISSNSEDLDIVKLQAALSSLTELLLAMEGIFRGAMDAEDDPEFAANEIFSGFLSSLSLVYLKSNSPRLYSLMLLLQTVNDQMVAEGGMVHFFKDVIGGFFKTLWNESLETEDGTKAVSDVIFLSFAGLLYLLEYLVDKYQKDVEFTIKAGFGFEGFASSTTPIADQITNRFFTYSAETKLQNSPFTFGKMFNTFGFVPKDHEGISFMIDLSGELDQDILLTEEIAVNIKASGEGIFRIGNHAEAVAGDDNKLKISYDHKLKKPLSWTMLDEPKVQFGYGPYKIAFNIEPDDFEVKSKFEIPFLFSKGDLKGFPWDFLPEKIDTKIPLGFGYSLTREFFFDDGGNPGKTSSEDSEDTEVGVVSEAPELHEVIISKLLNLVNIQIPIHENLGGIIGFETLNLKVHAPENLETIRLESSLDFWIRFGSAVTISISRLGMNLSLVERGDSGGILGYDLKPEIKPPNGAGIVVNAELIKGGGFLYFDDEAGEYFGALELEFKGLFAMKAVGIINTKMPDGSDGFSMLIIITAEFSQVQLGFGFTLNGVGGLLGIDRTVEVETLRIGIRTNSIKSVLFPEDVVGNISRIINDIRQIFPIHEDQFLIGLMGKFGWGTPTLLHIELGVIVELPDPKILVLGVIRLALPDEEAALLKLQVNFLGVLDFQNKFIYFEAHLFESKLVGYNLTGSLAFAVAWGNQSVFAISVGGFHPDFRDYPTVPTLPGAFRGMARIGLSLLSGDNPSLTIQCYLAVTSNSVQFGAKVELYAEGPMSFNLYGMLAFDALFIFDPFSFIISIEATLAIRKGTSILFGIHFKGKLAGPTPWSVEGKVSFSMLFFDVTISFSEQWGDPQPEIRAATEDLQALLLKEFDAEPNWKVLPVPSQHNMVAFREYEAGEEKPVLLQPFGELSFEQRAIPLNFDIEKYGTKQPLNINRFSITKVKIGGTELPYDFEQELFAPGHFLELSEEQKLTRKSFEKQDAGFKLHDSGEIHTSKPHGLVPSVLDYELNYTADDIQKPLVVVGMPVLGFVQLKCQSAISKSEVSWKSSNKRVLNQPEKVGIKTGGYTIARSDNMREYEEGLQRVSYSEISRLYDEMLKEQPELTDKIQIVENFELVS
ncbi:MAG: DUF6603 domain-containing protein [Salinimicrobium sp.]